MGERGAGREGRLYCRKGLWEAPAIPLPPGEGKQMLWSGSWRCNHWAGSFPRVQGIFGGTRWKFRTATIPPLAVLPLGDWGRPMEAV